LLQGWKRIEASLTSAMQEHFPREGVLGQKEIGMKFDKNTVITSKAMNWD
jgi:hypothetical protein